eukprot:gene10992-biopygen12369
MKLGIHFFVGNPGYHPPHPLRAAGCLCVCRISARGPFGEAWAPKKHSKSRQIASKYVHKQPALGVPVDGQVLQKQVSGGISLGTAPSLEPDGLVAAPDETVSGRACREHASFPKPGGVTAAPDETGNNIFCGQPWVPSTTPLASGGLSMRL